VPPARKDKSRLYAHLARFTKALAAPARLEMLDLLAQGERTVESLAEELGLSHANASKHLMVLREAQIVSPRRSGPYVYVRITSDAVPLVVHHLRTLAQSRLVALDKVVRELLESRDPLTPVGRDELSARVRDGDVIVLDVRPEAEFVSGHLPGAVCFPVESLTARLAELPRGKEVVAYCRGAWCVYAYDAVDLLRAAGFHARRLEDGFAEWLADGLPVEAGA
jgi:rhodanese-related sulfurtransferase